MEREQNPLLYKALLHRFRVGVEHWYGEQVLVVDAAWHPCEANALQILDGSGNTWLVRSVPLKYPSQGYGIRMEKLTDQQSTGDRHESNSN